MDKREYWIMTEFDNVLKNANEKFTRKKAEYGDSWESMTIEELCDRLGEEINEFCDAIEVSEEEAYNESLDVVNVALMIAERMRRKM